MWGTGRWGELVWGGLSVPSLPFIGLVALMLGCFIAGGYFLRPGSGRPRRWVAATLVFLLPLAVAAVPYTFTNGTIAEAPQVNANFAVLDAAIASLQNRLGVGPCPVGMTRIDTQFSTICYAAGPVGTWDQGAQYCWDNYRGHLCSPQQWRDTVCFSGTPNPGGSWTSDLSGTATAIALSACSSDGVATLTMTSSRKAVCCLEWMHY